MTQSKRNKGSEGKYRIRLEGLKREESPEVALIFFDENGKQLHTQRVQADSDFELPARILKSTHRVLVGPYSENMEELDDETTMLFRRDDFLQLLEENPTLMIPENYWRKWNYYIRCVTGSVRKCFIRPWWITQKLKALRPVDIQLGRLPQQLAEEVSVKSKLSIQDNILSANIIDDLLPPFGLRCAPICNGTVEVYRRICCCRPWIIDDYRIPELVVRLEDLIRKLPEIPRPPFPPDPPNPEALPFIKEGALDELTINAARDLQAIRSLPKAEVADYIQARPYLWHCTCGRPVKIGQTKIQPDGDFSFCWFDYPRFLPANCYERYSYVVKQVVSGITVTVYNGLAANQWFSQDEQAELVSYSPFARACRDNGARDDAYVYLELIGDTEAWHLKTPTATGWDRVASPSFNDGLVFPSDAPSPASGANDRNWGGTLKVYFKFSEGMKDIGAKYYRLSVTAADSNGDPTGARTYYGTGLSWEKSVGGGVTVPENMGPFMQGGQNNLYLIPYDSDADWDADQYHAYLNTNAAVWSNPNVRHLITLEVFDAAGQRLRPNGTPASGEPGAEIEAPFTYRRQYQDLGPTDNVPFAALTHMFWWDNRHSLLDIQYLVKNNLEYDEECQYLEGQPTSTFAVGYIAYHPNPLFQYYHRLRWHRGSGATPGSHYTLVVSTNNYTTPVWSPSNTFAWMLRTDLDPTRLKCSFYVDGRIYVKTFDGENRLSGLDDTNSWAFSIEIN